MAKPSIVKTKPSGNGKDKDFCRYFTHWRNGKVYDARDYGYKAWPIGRRLKPG